MSTRQQVAAGGGGRREAAAGGDGGDGEWAAAAAGGRQAALCFLMGSGRFSVLVFVQYALETPVPEWSIFELTNTSVRVWIFLLTNNGGTIYNLAKF